MKKYVNVHLLNAPYHIDRPYTYEVPLELCCEDIRRGSIVCVPFGKSNKQSFGVVTGFDAPDSAIKLKTVYNCGHIETKTDKTPEIIIGKTKEEIEKINPEWKIDEFSENFILVEEQIDKPCENHYIIKLKDNTLYVYKQNNSEEYIKKQVLLIYELIIIIIVLALGSLYI